MLLFWTEKADSKISREFAANNVRDERRCQWANFLKNKKLMNMVAALSDRANFSLSGLLTPDYCIKGAQPRRESCMQNGS